MFAQCHTRLMTALLERQYLLYVCITIRGLTVTFLNKQWYNNFFFLYVSFFMAITIFCILASSVCGESSHHSSVFYCNVYFHVTAFSWSASFSSVSKYLLRLSIVTHPLYLTILAQSLSLCGFKYVSIDCHAPSNFFIISCQVSSTDSTYSSFSFLVFWRHFFYQL